MKLLSNKWIGGIIMFLDIINWVKDNYTWEQISFMSAFASVIVAIIVWISSLFQIREMRRATNEANRPYVVAYYDAKDNGAVILVIENIGKSMASNVLLKTDREINFPKDQPVSKSNFFVNPIPNIPPNYKMHAFLGLSCNIMNKEGTETGKYKIWLRYQDTNKKQYIDEYILDLSPYLGTTQLREYTIHDLVKESQHYNKNFKSLSSELKKYLKQKNEILNKFKNEN